MRRRRSFVACISLALLPALLPLQPAWADTEGEALLAKLGVTRGICVVAGETSCQTAIKLAEGSELLVYTQLVDTEDVAQARDAVRVAGLDATRLQIDLGPAERLNLADSIADAVIVNDRVSRLGKTEALRVLRPGGIALIGKQKIVKPLPEGLDDWTHPYHGPDNNPLSEDTRIRAPYMTQFLADPRYGPAPQVAIAAAGRVFKFFGHIAWHEREEPLLNTLIAFNAFNGTELWKRPLPEGAMVHRNTMVATAGAVYFGDDKSCKVIDAVSGKLVDEIIPPTDIAGGTFWKWLAMEDGVLFAMLGEQEHQDETTRWKLQGHGWPWPEVSKGYNQPNHPWGFGRNLLAIDPKTKKVLWHYHEDEPMDARASCMKSGRIFAFRFGEYLTCLDAKTGDVLWRKTREKDPEFFKTLGRYLPRQSWETNWRTASYVKCTDDALYFAGPQMDKLIAVSTKDGRVLWRHPYDNFQLVIYPDSLYGISGPWGNNLSKRFDPLTGKVLDEFDAGRRACTRPTATTDSILFRAMGGSVRFDLADGSPRWISPMRPSCHDGVTVASGLLYWWPFACDCQLTLNGLTCAGPAGDFDFTPEIVDERLVVGDEGHTLSTTLDSSLSDWPTLRANNRRTATSLATIPQTVRVLWQTDPPKDKSARPTAPVTVGNSVFLADLAGDVRALDIDSGQTKWSVTTGGEIRIPPTIANGRAMVGSANGWVYALEAATGRVLWRFRAAPAERKIPVYGRLISTWPAASGVLVDDDTAYVAAGLVNYDGTYVYALDAATGAVRWCNDTSGHLDSNAKSGVSVQGHLLLDNNRLYMAGGNAVSPAVYDTTDGKCLNDATSLARCESTSPRGWELFGIGDKVVACGRPYYTRPELPVYDHTVDQKMLHTSSGDRDIVWLNSSKLICFDPLDKAELNRCVTSEKIARHITHAWGAFRTSKQPHWVRDVPGSVAIATATNAVVIADEKAVTAFSLRTGKTLWSQPLSAAPVPWGLAVNRHGQIVLTLVDGRVICVGR